MNTLKELFLDESGHSSIGLKDLLKIMALIATAPVSIPLLKVIDKIKEKRIAKAKEILNNRKRF